MKETSGGDQRVTAMQAVINALRELDVESQVRVINATCILMGFVGTVMKKGVQD